MWAVTVGSSAFLIFWILIYSFFTSIDFTDEIFLLFSTVDFLASVILALVVAIGKLPHHTIRLLPYD